MVPRPPDGPSHDDGEDDFVAVGVYRGKPAVRAFFEELFAAVPDLTFTVRRILADRDYATVQWRVTGRFSGGPFRGVHATGRRVELKGVDVMHIVDGWVQGCVSGGNVTTA
jgi:predicted ester cyclase